MHKIRATGSKRCTLLKEEIPHCTKYSGPDIKQSFKPEVELELLAPGAWGQALANYGMGPEACQLSVLANTWLENWVEAVLLLAPPPLGT